MSSLFNFAGKVALITGASSGIGRCTSVLFHKLGASLVITGRNKQRLEELKSELEKKDPKCNVHFVVADLAVESDIANIVKEVKDKFGKLDILVNNAGILENGTIENTSLESFDRVMNVNLRSVFLLTNLAVPLLEKSKGSIVNVSSVNGIRSFPNVLAYNISKAGLDQMTRCSSLELAPKGIRVNSINPGVTVTELHSRAGLDQATYQKFLERSKETHPLGRPGAAEECANAIAFLASSAASFTTGASLPVDGGRHATCLRMSAEGSETIRADFVENARKFFTNPKIRATPLEEQKKFLMSKGVTSAEIEAALAKIPEAELASNQTQPHYDIYPPPPPPRHPIFNTAQNLLLVGGATYMLYNFARSWLLPKFFDIPDAAEEERRELRTQLNELQNTTKFVVDTASQTLETVATQQEQLNRALMFISNNSNKENDMSRMQTDISVVKSLLLRTNQFPSVTALRTNDLNAVEKIPKLNGEFETDIPSWQLGGNLTADEPNETTVTDEKIHDTQREDDV